jgi:hypothetical protein
MSTLSPAAQTVLDAATEGFWGSSFNSESNGAAAALRAAADHLSYLLPFEDFGRVDVVDLLAIANELEGIPN